MAQIKFNVLVGVLLLLLITTIIVNSSSNSIKTIKSSGQQFSPDRDSVKLDTNIGLSHYSCASVCLQDRCEKSESFKGIDKYYCVCSTCESTNKCILSFNTRNSFTWDC
nr:hypothetical protein [Nanoarchaeum sp.]